MRDAGKPIASPESGRRRALIARRRQLQDHLALQQPRSGRAAVLGTRLADLTTELLRTEIAATAARPETAAGGDDEERPQRRDRWWDI